jgi:DNA-binding LacI/PurR family transcriptional regulator
MVDVARHAGVSIATVSRTLRGKPNVAATTRDRILRAAEELSYVVSPIASGLATGRTGAVGVLVPYASRWYFGQVVGGAEAVLGESGLDLLLYNLGDRAARQRFFDRQPLRRRVDAVLAVAMSFTGPELAALRDLRVPMAVIGTDGWAGGGVASVRIDEAATVGHAIRHLIGLGHRRIAMISTYADQSSWLPVAHERHRGYLAALADAGIPPDDRLVVSVPFSVGDGERAAGELLGIDDPPTAILAESDELAFGALTTLRRAGVAVPGALSVVGIDDHDVSRLLDLTTVRQSVFEQGALAARLLIDALAADAQGIATGVAAPALVVPTALVVRGSTGPAPDPGHHAGRR